MLRKLLNHAEIELTITPKDPLLIASGVPNALGTDMPFVLTYRNNGDRGDRGEPYLPGSSLKGVFRSHLEKISRSIAPNAKVCDPHFKKSDESGVRQCFCGERLSKKKNGKNSNGDNGNKEKAGSHGHYKESCPICRTFGSTVYRGRLSIGDAYLKDSSFTIENRDGVGIDRFTGGASRGAKFNMEVLTSGTFSTRLRLENFEDWQLGLLAILCRDLKDEMISIGHSTTRGLGRIQATLDKCEIGYVVPFSKKLKGNAIYGVGSLLEDDDERNRYGYKQDDKVSLTQSLEPKRDGIRLKQSFTDSKIQNALFDDAIGRWADRMEAWGKK